MFCTIIEEELLALVNTADYTSCLARPDTTEIGFTANRLKPWFMFGLMDLIAMTT